MKRGIITELKTIISIMGVLKEFFSFKPLRAFADENPEPNPTPEPNPEPTRVINYEDLISNARKQEREKYYGTIENLKQQNAKLIEQHNEDLLKIGQLEKDIKTVKEQLLTAGKEDSEEVKTLKKTVKDLEKQIIDLNAVVKDYEEKTVSREEIEKEVRSELETEYETRTYKAEKMAELKEEILVPELVFGNTKEEIDASIEAALAKSKEIREKLGATTQLPQPNSRTPRTITNPSVSRVQDAQFSNEYIASLDVRSPEYAEMRKQLGLH